MRNRTLARSATGIIVAAAALFIMALPASANTVDVEITSGFLDLYDENGDPVESIGLGEDGEGVSCGSDGSVTATDDAGVPDDDGELTGLLDIDLLSCTCINVAGTNYVAELTVSLVGTYHVIPPTEVSLAGGATALLTRSTGPGSCTKLNGAGPCTVTVGNLSLVGHLAHANAMPTLASGDSAVLAGGNAPGDVVVTGSPTNCGLLIALHNGYVDIPPWLVVTVI